MEIQRPLMVVKHFSPNGAGKIFTKDTRGSLFFTGFPKKDFQGFGGLFANDHGDTRLDDTRLFPGDFFKGVSQNLGVLQADGHDDGHQGFQHVG